MKKGYWVVTYRSVSDLDALKSYGELAIVAISAHGGVPLVRTADAIEAHELGLVQRTVVIEYESFDRAKETYASDAYKAALKVLGNTAERDFRIVEGV